jgi:hypothetical protein
MTPGSADAASKPCTDYSLVPAFLRCPMDPEDNDAGASTVREYLTRLLLVLWRERDLFSAKRPFGGSGWYWDIYGALQAAGLMEDFDDRGGERIERERVDRVIAGCIWTMGYDNGR